MKCSVVERVQRTLREKRNYYFTFKNSYRYIDVLQKFVKAYNNTVHSTTGTAPSKCNDPDNLTIWKRMSAKRLRIRSVKAKFSVGQHVKIRKGELKFAKASQQNFSTEIFGLVRSFIELQDPSTNSKIWTKPRFMDNFMPRN